MASSETNAAVAAHREAFHREVEVLFEKYDASHSVVKSRAEYDALTSFLRGPAKDKNVKKNSVRVLCDEELHLDAGSKRQGLFGYQKSV